MFGFLNVYKPKGKTSHDVVAILRRILGIKQIGHTGTLDPFAEGVLPICIGKATRLIEYLDDDKAYKGVIQLGNSTTTYDIEGEVVLTSQKIVTLEDIEAALQKFRGNIKQLPPIYSAIKVCGKKLYEYARNGETVDIKPREVCISKLEIINYDEEKRQLELYIECSKGTYIRSIANDLGEVLGTYGHLIQLTRTKAGQFYIEDSIRLENIKQASDVEKSIINPIEYLNYTEIELNEAEKALISNGMAIQTDTANGTTIATSDNILIAIGTVTDNRFKPEKVFI